MGRIVAWFGLFAWLWVLAVAIDLSSGHFMIKNGGHNTKQLRCHDCSDSDCPRLMSQGWGGMCTTREGVVPKCFVRMDPNGLVYRGCADHNIWPKDLALDYNGCAIQRYGKWSEKKVPWCLCDYNYCNVNIQKVMQHYGEVNNNKVMHTSVVHIQPQPIIARPIATIHYSADIVPRRPQQKRVMFYKPLGYPNNHYSEPIEKKPHRIQPHQPRISQPSWYDDMSPSRNQPWIPPAKVIPAKPQPPKVYYTSPAPTERLVTTTTLPTTTAPTMSQDLGPFEHSKDPNTNIEGKMGPKGDMSENEASDPFDLSKIPDWLWGKIFPREEDMPNQINGRQAPVDDLDPNTIPQEPVRDPHSCMSMKCEHDCQIIKDHPVCICPAGYQLRTDGRTCDDINECLVRNGDCSHDCRNTMGSHICECPAGYELDVDQKTCQDYNECPLVNCQHGCRNMAGSYQCTCRIGYVLNSDGKTCDDINECRDNTHGCDHVCVNTLGSYTCRCNHGYYLDTNERSCRDTNECKVENGGCEQGCQNTAGSYVCYCNRGYRLNVDGKTCDDVDECLTNNGGCDHTCWNMPGSYECRCNTGYQLDTDRRSCIDINECRVENGGCDHQCENIEGSYRCLCRSGYSLNVDQRSCDAIDKCSINNGGCEHVCTTTPTGSRCSCYPGFMLRTDGQTCADINECQTNRGGCDHQCVNTVGSYRCACTSGYKLNVDNATCDDINECQQNKGGCSQSCQNLPGSYRCACDLGYELMSDEKRCTDINECLVENGGCQQNCTNTEGSFRCSCDGIIYRLHEDGRRCIGTCPKDFVKNEDLNSCYKVFTPVSKLGTTMRYSLDVDSAQEHCRSLHPLGGLLSIQTDAEQKFLSDLLKKEPQMLEGWQGWWTSGKYHSGLNVFKWSEREVIDNNSAHWGFRKTPVVDTCVWVLQISVYNQTWGNYDCFTSSGHICEVELPSK